MALNLKNYQAKIQKKSKGRNINGGNALKNASIVIHSISALALKNATNDTIDSKAINGFPKIPLPRNRPPHSSYKFKCKTVEDVEFNLKLSETCLDKQEILSDRSFTFAQIQSSCALSKGPPRPIYIDYKPKTAQDVEQELICLGCKNCHIYVLVPSDNPKCPNCFMNKYLIDIPKGNPVKRERMD